MISQSISESNITFLINKSKLTKALSVLEIGLLNKEIVKEIKFEVYRCQDTHYFCSLPLSKYITN